MLRSVGRVGLQPGPDDINERADQILSRAEFNRSESVLDRIGNWLNNLLSDLTSSLSQGGSGTLVAWLILAVLVTGGAFLLARLAPWKAVGRREKRPALKVDTTSAELRTAEQWRLEADRFVSEGDFDRALRARYRAVLADLVTQGAIEDVAGRTPGEYRREMANGAPSAAGAFADLTDQFEVVWYGPGRATADTLATFDTHEQAVLVGVSR